MLAGASLTTRILAAAGRSPLLPEKAAFSPASATLLVADAHVGKAVSFRALGVPVPRGTTSGTLARSIGADAAHRRAALVFLGDFLHSARRMPRRRSARWRAGAPRTGRSTLTLVRGNHDDRAGDPPASWASRSSTSRSRWAASRCATTRARSPASYVLAGHLHPCVSVGARLRHLRCRVSLRRAVGVLPAFGAFTGMHPVPRGTGDRVFAIADGVVAAMPCAACAVVPEACGH